MNILQKTAANNPKTTLLLIIDVLVVAWNWISDNAELFGFSGKAIMIGFMIITGLVMINNVIQNHTGSDDDTDGLNPTA